MIIVRYIQLRRERNLLRKLCDRLAEALGSEQGRTNSLALDLHRCEKAQGDLRAQLEAMDEIAESELAELRSRLAAAECERDNLRAERDDGLQRERFLAGALRIILVGTGDNALHPMGRDAIADITRHALENVADPSAVARAPLGDLDDLQGFIDVVADGAVTPDDIAVAREALGALHKHLRGNAP